MKIDFLIEYDDKAGYTFSHTVDESQQFNYIAFENHQYSFFLKGVLLNFDELIQDFGVQKDITSLITELYNRYNFNFSTFFRGEFSGYFFEKETLKMSVFSNIIGSQTIFYYYFNSTLCVNTDFKQLKKQLDQKNLPFSFDVESAYSMLTFHNLIDNNTHIREVKKIIGGETLLFNPRKNSIQIISTDNLQSIKTFTGNKPDALNQLDYLFSKAVNQEYSYDQKIGKAHFALLSGGLDSRMGIFYAYQQKFRPISSLCFSHSGYWDETIAKEIADDLDINLHIKHLDGGHFLMDIDGMTPITQGLTRYTGGAHSNYGLKSINLKDFGLIHTGHLGDAVLGSYLSSKDKASAQNGFRKIYASQYFREKTNHLLIETAKKYPTEEIFLLYNRGFNAIAIGNHVAEQYSIPVSPFMHTDFLKFGLSLPEKWRFNEAIYIEWIRKYCPDSTRYIWERTLLKPNKVWKTSFADHIWVRLFGLYYKKIIRKPEKFSMTPYEYYYKTNHEIKPFFEKYFSENVEFAGDIGLERDLYTMFRQGSFTDKTLVLGLLGVYKWLKS